jgi:hypothetical protein
LPFEVEDSDAFAALQIQAETTNALRKFSFFEKT